MPGDPTSILIAERIIKPAMVQEIKEKFGLTGPLWLQYILYIKNLLSGYLGYSFTYQRPVLDEIMARLPNTIILMGVSTVFSFIIGVITGLVSGWRRGKKIDLAILTSAMIFYSLPVFWIGLLLLLFFSYYLNLFPAAGTLSRPPPVGFIPLTMDYLYHLVLPALTVTIVLYGSYTLIMRSTLLDVLRQDYIMIAKAKGLSEREVMFKHAMKNAMLPVVTQFAISLGYIVGGAVLTETVFSWQGIGRLIFEAEMARDYPVLQGVFFIITLSVILANYLADILYAYLDPRIRY